MEAASDAPMALCEFTGPGSMAIELAVPGYSISESGDVHRLTVDGMGSGGPAGHPELPGTRLRFALPPETNMVSVRPETRNRPSLSIAPRSPV